MLCCWVFVEYQDGWDVRKWQVTVWCTSCWSSKDRDVCVCLLLGWSEQKGRCYSAVHTAVKNKLVLSEKLRSNIHRRAIQKFCMWSNQNGYDWNEWWRTWDLHSQEWRNFFVKPSCLDFSSGVRPPPGGNLKYYADQEIHPGSPKSGDISAQKNW